MADIFMSWGSPDSAMVKPLRDRLRDVGLDVWEYSEDMGAGDAIQNRVMRTIEQSRIAIFCLSDATVQREWVKNEIAACVFAYQTTGQIEHLIPVKVGALSEDNIPALLKQLNLYIFDLSDPGRMSENLERLIDDLHEILGQRAPLIMPAAIFAMTESESLGLFKSWKQAYDKIKAGPQQGAGAGGRQAPQITQEQEEFWRLCKLVGMQDPPELFEFLRNRYGNTAEQLKPFESEKTIIDAINAILREVNAARLGDSHRPIFLRWVTDKLFEGTGDERDDIRDEWRSRDSLLIVDSVSTFYLPIRDKLSQVPAQRTALLWLPPYTRHTAGLESSLRSSARFIPTLGDEFRDWGKHPRRSVSFDTSTSLALQVWLRRALFQISDEPGALKENVDSISAASQAGNIGAGIFKKGSHR